MWGRGPALYKHNYFINVIRGSRPVLHFPPPTPPEDYSQFLAALAKIEDSLHLGVCEYCS